MQTRLGTALVIVGMVGAAACGGGQPAPEPVAKPTPAPAKAPPAVVSCEDASVILLPGGTGAVRERSAAIATACKADTWSQAVLACIGTSHEPRSCLDELTEAQSSSLDGRISAVHDSEDDDSNHDVVGAVEVPCDAAVLTPETYAPVLDERAPERDWDTGVRKRTLVEACEDEGWLNETRTCLLHANGDARQTAVCLEAVDSAAHLKTKLGAIDALAAAIARAKTKPASIGCKRVVAAHYGDAQWKDKLDGFKPAERKKMIAESRAKMQKACADLPWDDTLRSCIVVGGGETCFQSYRMGLGWGYPAAGVRVALGIPECDDYAAALAQIVACDKLPQVSRDALQKSSEELFSQVLARPQKERASFASTCKAGADAMHQALSSIGC